MAFRTFPNPVDPEQALDLLRRAPLRNVVLLKLLLAYRDGATVYQISDSDTAATLLLLDHQVSPFDREAYPAARASVVISSDSLSLTRQLLEAVPRGETLIFKLASEDDVRAVAERFPLSRLTAFHSYTAAHRNAADPQAEIEKATDAPFHLFEAQGHEAGWLRPLLAGGKAFTSVIRKRGEPLAACFAFQIDGAVWEVGGVYTRPDHRGKGFGRRVVHAALAELERSGRFSRYQVAESNQASIRIADALGMERFLTLTHYQNEI